MHSLYRQSFSLILMHHIEVSSFTHSSKVFHLRPVRKSMCRLTFALQSWVFCWNKTKFGKTHCQGYNIFLKYVSKIQTKLRKPYLVFNSSRIWLKCEFKISKGILAHKKVFGPERRRAIFKGVKKFWRGDVKNISTYFGKKISKRQSRWLWKKNLWLGWWWCFHNKISQKLKLFFIS